MPTATATPSMTTVWMLSLPAIPGPDLRCSSHAAALREQRKAERAGRGQGASIRSLRVYVSTRTW